ARDKRVAVAVRRANRCLARSIGVPRQSKARCKMPPLIVDACIARKTGIAGEVHAGRCIREYLALDALLEPVVVEVHGCPERRRTCSLRKVRIPSDAVIQGYLGR